MIYNTLIRTLLENNSVTISGFGTFCVKQLAAQLKGDIIYPPQTIIEFEYQKNIEDFSFVNKLSQWEQIRINEAQDKVSEWVALIETGLEHNKSVFFDDFGTFSKDPSGKIIFQGMINAQLNIENEGLEPIILPQKNPNKRERNMADPVKDKRIVLHKKNRRRDRFLFLSITFAAIVLLCVLFFKDQVPNLYQTISTNIKNIGKNENIDNKNNTYISKIAEEESEVINETENSVTSIATDSISEEANVMSSDNKVNTPVSLSASQELYLSYQKGLYYIIAGSFVTEESALLHINQKKLDKYHAKLIVHPDNPRIRICIGIFDNEEDAIQNAVQTDKNYWVLK
ncbi:MAG: hypothetical protein FWC10_04270 [Lentimicrobiaceae bacterium]|nr:hypothetical protein [Lentimicrobiaceae bacterium]